MTTQQKWSALTPPLPWESGKDRRVTECPGGVAHRNCYPHPKILRVASPSFYYLLSSLYH